MCISAVIGLRNADGSLKFVYCPQDGLKSVIGAMLLGHYTSLSKVEKLISMGNIYSLKEYIDLPRGKVHTFEKPVDNVSIFYRRDTGASLQDTRAVKNLADIQKEKVINFLYIFDTKAKVWEFYSPVYTAKGLTWDRYNYNSEQLITNAVKNYGMLKPKVINETKKKTFKDVFAKIKKSGVSEVIVYNTNRNYITDTPFFSGSLESYLSHGLSKSNTEIKDININIDDEYPEDSYAMIHFHRD